MDVSVPTRIPGLDKQGIKQLTAKGESSAALTITGKVYSWGNGKSFQLTSSSNSSTTNKLSIPTLLKIITTPQIHSTSPTPKLNSQSQLIPPSNSTINNNTNQHNDSLIQKRENLVKEKREETEEEERVVIKKVSLGLENISVVTEQGKVLSWRGGNSQQQQEQQQQQQQEVKEGNPNSHLQLPNILKDKKIKKIVSGGYHSVALLENGLLYSWGLDQNGRLGRGSETGMFLKDPLPIPSLFHINVKQVACGKNHTIILTSNEIVMCWGKGYLGNGSFQLIQYPTIIQSLLNQNIIQIASGGTFFMALSKTGILWSWGVGYNGELGLNTLQEAPLPTPISSFPQHLQVIQVCCGVSHTICLTQRKPTYLPIF